MARHDDPEHADDELKATLRHQKYKTTRWQSIKRAQVPGEPFRPFVQVHICHRPTCALQCGRLRRSPRLVRKELVRALVGEIPRVKAELEDATVMIAGALRRSALA